MPGIMPDNDVRGQFKALLTFLQGPIWGDVWKKLGLTLPEFETLGLTRSACSPATERMKARIRSKQRSGPVTRSPASQ